MQRGLGCICSSVQPEEPDVLEKLQKCDIVQVPAGRRSSWDCARSCGTV